MPIEFSCPHCQSTLRTPESKAGLSARCPACGDPIWVPHASEPWDPGDGWVDDGPSAVREQAGPVADGFERPGAHPTGKGRRLRSRKTRPVDLGTILSASWRIYSGNLGICLLATLIDLVTTFAAILLVMIPAGLCLLLLRDSPILGIPALMLTLFLGWTTALSAAAVGHLRFFLALARGQQVRLGEMFHFGNSLGPMAVASVGFWAITIFGLFLCVIPGLLALVMFWPYGRFVVDEETPASQSLTDAYRLTSENFWTSLFIVLLNFLVIGAANFIPFLGYVFAIPFAAVLHTVAYLHFRGEFVTGDRDNSEL